MIELADGWCEIETGFQRGENGPRLTIDPSHVETSEHGRRVQAPVESPNAYTVSVWRRGSHDHLVHFEDRPDAITFAELVTQYVEEQPVPGALRDLAKGMPGGFETGELPTEIVNDRGPRGVLKMMLGSEAYRLKRALDDK